MNQVGGTFQIGAWEMPGSRVILATYTVTVQIPAARAVRSKLCSPSAASWHSQWLRA